MNEKEQLQKLEAELERLASQLAQQQQELAQLRQQIIGVQPDRQPSENTTEKNLCFR